MDQKHKILKNRERHLLEDYISILLTNFGAIRLNNEWFVI